LRGPADDGLACCINLLIEMAKPDDQTDNLAFLRGGGATAALIAEFDWASTPLGSLNAWPQSLKNTTALMLRSSVPMALLWGEDGVTIYNDAYSRLLGKAGVRTLGSKARETSPVADLSERAIRTGLAGDTLAVRDLEITIERSGKRQQAWVDIDCSPVLDDAGQPAGVLSIVVETTPRVLAERRAELEIERLRRMFEQAPGFICLLSGPEHIFEFVNDAHKQLFGDRGAVGRPFREIFANITSGLPDVLEQVWRTRERFIARAAPVALVREAGAPPEERYLDFVLEPLTGDDGEMIAVFVEGFDVTEQVRANAAAEESARRLSAAIAVARLGAFELDQETGLATLDERAREIYGFGPDERLTIADLTRRIDSRDLVRVSAEAAAADASQLGRHQLDYRIHLPDGSTRSIASISDRMLGPDGRIQRVVGVFDDVTERRRAEQRQRLLINELNHRVKNTLVTVQSIAAQTLRSAQDLPCARAAFEARLMALAAAHDLLTKESWHGARLADVVAAAMAPFEAVQQPQISRVGPHVWLTAQRAMALNMALHELATNAVKYGALSRPEGRVAIRWRLVGDDDLNISWREAGGPPVAPSGHSGFGSRMLLRSLARELAADVDLTFAPDGVRCEIRCKVEPTWPAPDLDIAEA
jgi:two-component sensor histidine kinase/PAS domain-containing protein